MPNNQVPDFLNNSQSRLYSYRTPFLRFFDSSGNLSFVNGTQGELTSIINNIKNSGNISDEELKPLLDKISSSGYNIGSNFSLTQTGSPSQPGTYTPATPPPINTPIPTRPAPSEVPGQPIPGAAIDLNSDRGQIEQEAAREKQQQLEALSQAAALRDTKIGSLGDILLKQNQAQFNYDLPGIKEDLASSGLFTSPSALAAAVARESGMLGANTQAQLSQAGLANIDLQAEGLLGANQAQQQLQQSGLQRQFSVSDWQRQAELAKQIGSNIVPQAPAFSFTGALGGGAAAGTAGSALLASNPALYAGLIGASALAGGTKSYVCTAMREAGILSQEEVEKIHDHIFPMFPKNISLVIAYGIYGPQLVAKAIQKGIDWKRWKEFFFGRVVREPDQEKAFDLYADAFFKLWKEVA